MRRVLGNVIDAVGAAWSLFRLAWQTRFRIRGRYWNWRRETAFGGGEPAPAAKRRMAFHYARWVWRMGRHQ